MRRSSVIDRLVCAGLLAVAAPSGARALRLPVSRVPAYDVDKVCARPFSGDRTRTNACIRAEQDAYEHLKAVWLTVDRRAIVDCEEQIRARQDMTFFYERMDRCIPAISQAFGPKPPPEAPEHFQP